MNRSYDCATIYLVGDAGGKTGQRTNHRKGLYHATIDGEVELPSKAGYPRIRIWDGTLTRVVPGRLEAMQPCLRWGKQQMCSINPLPRDGQRVAWDYVPVAFFEIWSFKTKSNLSRRKLVLAEAL